MEISSKSKLNISDDGTFTFVCERLTPTIINELIEIIRKVEFCEVVKIVNDSNGMQETADALCKKFNLTHSQAHFILETYSRL